MYIPIYIYIGGGGLKGAFRHRITPKPSTRHTQMHVQAQTTAVLEEILSLWDEVFVSSGRTFLARLYICIYIYM